MRIRGSIAVLVLTTAAMFAQSAPAAPDTANPAQHAECKRDKDGKMACCKKDKDGNMSKDKDCCKKGKCAREKKDADNKS
jgi:hypothetical protein